MKVSIKLATGKVISNEYGASSVTIGRSNKCDFPVADESLSRTHAQIEVIDGDFFVTDLGSANGVYLDGTRIPAQDKTQFNSFQQLTIGPLECQVEDTSDAPAATTAHPSMKMAEGSSDLTTPTRTSKLASKTSHPTTKKAPEKKKAQEKTDLKKFMPLIVLALGAVIFYFFNSTEEASDANKSPEEQLVISNVPEGLRDVKDHFSDYLVVYAGNGCDKDAELCKGMNLSTQNGEGIVKEGKEVFVFINPSAHLEEQTFTKVKENAEIHEIIALYLLLQSSLMREFDKKSIGQVHLILLDKDLKQTKVFRFHQKYFAGNEIARMLTELGEVVDNGGRTEAFWTYANPLIKRQSL